MPTTPPVDLDASSIFLRRRTMSVRSFSWQSLGLSIEIFPFFFLFSFDSQQVDWDLRLVQYFVTFFFLFKRKRKWNKINKYTVVEKNVLCWWVGLLSSLPPHSRLAHYIACPWNSRSKYEYRIVWKLLWCVSFFFSFSPHSPFPKHIFKW